MDKNASMKPSDVVSKNPNKMIRQSLAAQMLDQ
jgi:hypothetical protein